MGFDKPDLGFVVHLGAPSSPVAYYQQIGRAGRAVERAEVVLLPGAEDRDIWAYFASLAFPPEPLVAPDAASVLSERPLSTAAIETRVDLSRTRLEMLLKVLDADGAVRRVSGGWVGDRASRGSTTPSGTGGSPTAREAEQQAMLAYLAHAASAAWSSCAASSTTRTPSSRAAAATTAPAPSGPSVDADTGGRGAAAARRPGVERPAAQAVAHRA